MAITLTNLIEMVNTELENRTHFGTAEVVADGVRQDWNIAPLGYKILDDVDFLVLQNGVEVISSEYSMNFDSGVCHIDTLPTLGDTMKWYFNYRTWDDTQVTTAINAGIQSLFPAIYSEVVLEETADGVADEFDLDPYVEYVKSYDWQTTGATTWERKRARDFEIFRDDDHKVISFFSPPAAGTLRLHTISRPVSLSSTTDDLVADSLIPERCAFPVVSYACYYLLTQRTAPRAKGDVAIITQGSGTLSPRQMNDAANAFYLRYQMQLAAIKMPPWSMR